eukprot:TRINITY_DN3878_c0_g1_i1.p1 TRINITY_DN3878_c0_g1~~TRINITY_DN3878_c0_g1_i1.p1  ORF type:complete len:152 (+),score=24.29 TRINITY_DN3878_c0_g1_i1:102-557(+)
MNNPKRKRVTRACNHCQKSHLACNDSRPCNRCIKKGLESTCVDGIRKTSKKTLHADNLNNKHKKRKSEGNSLKVKREKKNRRKTENYYPSDFSRSSDESENRNWEKYSDEDGRFPWEVRLEEEHAAMLLLSLKYVDGENRFFDGRFTEQRL